MFISFRPHRTEARKSAVVPGPAILVLSKLVLKGNLKLVTLVKRRSFIHIQIWMIWWENHHWMKLAFVDSDMVVIWKKQSFKVKVYPLLEDGLAGLLRVYKQS